jgi:hypothetical protein
MRRLNIMVNLRQKLLVAALMLGVSLSLFAQKGNDNSNKRPPKVDPPQVVVKEKPKPTPNPPSNPKKP